MLIGSKAGRLLVPPCPTIVVSSFNGWKKNLKKAICEGTFSRIYPISCFCMAVQLPTKCWHATSHVNSGHWCSHGYFKAMMPWSTSWRSATHADAGCSLYCVMSMYFLTWSMTWITFNFELQVAVIQRLYSFFETSTNRSSVSNTRTVDLEEET